MSHHKIPFGKRYTSEGYSIVPIEFVNKGLACDCVCPGCEAPLVAAKGDIYEHYFRHANGYGHSNDQQNQLTCPETALHAMAKQIVANLSAIQLPAFNHVETVVLPEKNSLTKEITIDLPSAQLEIMSSRVEKHISTEIRPDVQLLVPSSILPLCIEIVVSHKTTEKKRKLLKKQGLWALEIYLSDLNISGKDQEVQVFNALNEAHRYSWIHHPVAATQLALARKEAIDSLRKEDKKRNATIIWKSINNGPSKATTRIQQTTTLHTAKVWDYGSRPETIAAIKHLNGQNEHFTAMRPGEPSPAIHMYIRHEIKNGESSFINRYCKPDFKPLFRYWNTKPAVTLGTALWVLYHKKPKDWQTFSAEMSRLIPTNPRLIGFDWDWYIRQTSTAKDRKTWVNNGLLVKNAPKTLFKCLLDSVK
ncbi:hypothetical protein [Reinekea sp. G2M2-21]|uniref:hypothetical protein n=1 Tax=Reinekea sp. G2M2-21 TaxID=2788942 RepID=UPI0018AB5DB7|nr:hypothetical protein [Reinekea sp. G2M2-21]